MKQQEGWGYERSGYLGASDTPLILGLSRWGTALDVYRDKVGESEPDEMSLAAELGLDLERSIKRRYELRYGVKLRRSNKLWRYPKAEFIGCHPDFIGPDGLTVEAKTSASFKGWGDEPDGAVPPDYWAQVQHQMLVRGTSEVHVAVLFLGYRKDFRVYHINRDDEFIQSLIEELTAFWTEHVVPRVPPELDGTERTAQWLTERHPVGSGLVKPATAEQQLLARQLREVRQRKAEAERQENELRNRVRDIIGEDTGLRGSGFTFKWSQVKAGQPVVNWEAVASAYRELLELGDVSRDAADLDVIESLHTGPGRPAGRQLRLTFHEEEETDE